MLVLSSCIPVLAVCATAQAGTEVISDCPSAGSTEAGPWSSFGSPGPAKTTCAGGVGEWIGPRGGSLSPGSGDGLLVAAPAGSGITIPAAKIWWAVPSGSGATVYALASASGTPVAEGYAPLNDAIAPSEWTLPPTTTSLVLEDYCSNSGGGGGCSYSANGNVSLQLYGSQLTVADSRLPSGRETGGGLASSSPVSGEQVLGYDAEDHETGVKLVQLLIDGQPVASYAASCPYTTFLACPAEASSSLGWNTASVADGEHTVQLTVENATQNTATVYTGTITTDNAPADSSPPTITDPSGMVTGSTLTAEPGGWSTPTGAGSTSYSYEWQDCGADGEGCAEIPGASSSSYTLASSDVGHTLRVAVKASDSDGSQTARSNPTETVAAPSSSLGAPNGPGGSDPGSSSSSTGTQGTQGTTGAQGSSGAAGTNGATGAQGAAGALVSALGAPNGSGASQSAVLHLGVTATIARTFKTRAMKLTGRLTSSTGQPIAGASLEVLARTAGTSALKLLTHAKTTTNGTFTVQLPAGPSRAIEVAYRAYPSDASYTATASLTENVDAGARLRISPRSTSSTGTITLSGQVYGPIPHHGLLIEVLVKYHGKWVPVPPKPTNSHGAFTVAYQFQGSIGLFPFRVKIPGGQAGFPYRSGYSNTVDVHTH
jgi:hypothetical protein